MSKEREFLKKLRYASLLENDLRKELEELLAQPEYEGLTPREALTEYKRGYAQAELDLKREPLSYEQIEAAREGNTITVHAFARAVEKAHGIGGEE